MADRFNFTNVFFLLYVLMMKLKFNSDFNHC